MSGGQWVMSVGERSLREGFSLDVGGEEGIEVVGKSDLIVRVDGPDGLQVADGFVFH
jgi:hypothetical protein